MEYRRISRTLRRHPSLDTAETGLDQHPARGDLPLSAALDDASMGRWEGPRDLLAATGWDWDRRIFRLQVLARAGVNLRFAETWARAEPASADALAMLAHVQALRSMVAGPNEGRELMEQSRTTCMTAADANGADLSPWVVLLALLRVHCPEWSVVQEVWAQVVVRDPYNREAHHEVLTYLFNRNHGLSAAECSSEPRNGWRQLRGGCRSPTLSETDLVCG